MNQLQRICKELTKGWRSEMDLNQGLMIANSWGRVSDGKAKGMEFQERKRKTKNGSTYIERRMTQKEYKRFYK